jgi:hypothetical protein
MQDNNGSPQATRGLKARPKLSRRDYVLVPLLSILTIIAMLGAAEIGTRLVWTAHDDDDSCFFKDRAGLLRAKPNCTVHMKIAEGPWVVYRFNACGYRTDAPCGAKPPGALRIVLLGSSVSEGLNVPYEQTFGARTARALTAATGRSVQVQNLGFENLSPLHCYRKLAEVLALHPDLVVYAVTPFDIDQELDPVQLAHRNDPPLVVSPRPAAHFQVAPVKLLQEAVNQSRAVLIAQHLLFSNTETYLRLYMAYGDRADYLRTPLNSRWQARFSDFNLILTDMASRLRRAGIPLLVMAVPSLPQAALLSVKRPPPHTDPFVFSRPLEAMTARLGVGYVDALVDFERVPRCDRLFYVVDSHLTGDGNAVVARALIRKCLDGSVPAFEAVNTQERSN